MKCLWPRIVQGLGQKPNALFQSSQILWSWMIKYFTGTIGPVYICFSCHVQEFRKSNTNLNLMYIVYKGRIVCTVSIVYIAQYSYTQSGSHLVVISLLLLAVLHRTGDQKHTFSWVMGCLCTYLTWSSLFYTLQVCCDTNMFGASHWQSMNDINQQSERNCCRL